MTESLQLVCWDFDRTIINYHTKGFQSAARLDELRVRVSPYFLWQFKHLAQQNVDQAITTWCDDVWALEPGTVAGADMIRRILRPILPSIDQTPVVAKQPEYWNRWSDKLFPPGKRYHIQQAMSFYGITSMSRVLLIDDGLEHCQIAIRDGAQAMHVDGTNGFETPFLVNRSHV